MDNTSDSNQPVNQAPVQQKPIPVNSTTVEVKNKVVPPWVTLSEEPVKGSASGAAPPAPTPSVEAPAKKEPSPKETIKKSPFKKLFPLIILLVFGVGFLFLITKVVLPLVKKSKNGGSAEVDEVEKITLTYWGLWEAEEIMNPIIAEYQETYPNIIINYSQQSYKDYRERLQSALARDEGPDVFRFHNTWLVMLKKRAGASPFRDLSTN